MPVRERIEGPVLVVTIDRPEARNAIDPETHARLLRAWRRLRDDERLRVGVLTGAGTLAFCAGIDLKRLEDFYAEAYPGARRERFGREPGLGGLTRNFDPGKPVIAAVNGYCLGLGLELALACDLRLASPNATFGLPEVRWGIIPGQGGTQRLARAIPANLALEMILTGGPISAERAVAIGLVNRLVPSAALVPEAVALGRTIAQFPARAVRLAREAVRRGLDLPLPEALQFEQDLADPLRSSPESQEARRGFGGRDRRASPPPSPRSGSRPRRRRRAR